MDNIELKQLGKDNIPEVRQLFSACDDYFQLIDGVSVCGCRAEAEFECILDDQQGDIYGIYNEDKLIGVFFVLEQHPEKKQVTISLLLIHPSFRNRAIGRKVLTFVEDRARAKGCEAIVVGVDEINRQAFRFWEQHEFKETGKRKAYQHVMRSGDIVYLEKVLAY